MIHTRRAQQAFVVCVLKKFSVGTETILLQAAFGPNSKKLIPRTPEVLSSHKGF
jgi:hypothetical protein